MALRARHANFERELPSRDVRHVADWVVHSGDNNGGAGHPAGTPKTFYEDVVRTAFSKTYGIVYVLPEIRSVREVFKSYDAGDQAP